ncbi:MAG: sirohydrochlorin cobaltochelatase, partial [archaeon]|nr:sirohydrochlorin cobaltochelatase [archaeon]
FTDVMNAVIKEFYPAEKDAALVLMGHGTVHYANSTYSEMQLKFWYSGYENVYVTTAEGFPSFEDTIKCMRGKGYKKATLVPLMVVAGDHANNDLASDEDDSLNTLLKNEGYETTPIVKGLGENKSFQELFVKHALEAKQI